MLLLVHIIYTKPIWGKKVTFILTAEGPSCYLTVGYREDTLIPARKVIDVSQLL